MALTDSDTFYLNAMQHFDEERHLFQKNIDLVSPSQSEIHLLDWDSRQRREDMEVAKVELHNAERNISLHESKIKQLKDSLWDNQSAKSSRKKQIELLSELSQPVQHDITYVFNDSYPLSKDSSAVTKGKYSNPDEVKKLITRRYRTGEIVKLETKLADLNKEVGKNTGALMLRIAELKSNLSKCESATYDNVKEDYKNAAKMIDELEKLDYQCYRTVRETLQLRLRIMIAQREEIEENESLLKDRTYFEKKEAEARQQLITDTNTAKKRLDNELKATTAEYQRQLEELDKSAEVLKKSRKNVQDTMDNGIVDKLRNRYKTVKGRYIKLKKRHALEMEGFQNEAKMLRDKIKSLQKQIAISDRISDRSYARV